MKLKTKVPRIVFCTLILLFLFTTTVSAKSMKLNKSKMVVTASTKTGKHYFYIHVDGSDLSKSEILLFEGSTASITFTFQPSNHPVEGFNELHEKHRKKSGV